MIETAVAWLAANWVTVVVWMLAAVGALALGTYFVPWALSLPFMLFPQDLKRKYDAKWALVTGGSSGIGKAIVKRLAAQGLEGIVIAAYPDKLLEDCADELPEEFPDVTFRFVDVDLSSPEPERYLGPIREATKDVDVQIVFCNAGYIRTGLFDVSPAGKQLHNLHVNATSSTALAHHFLLRMKESALRGCIVFTSSPAFLTPTPLALMYGATKAYLTHMGSSLASEVVELGIDVSVLHPSPVRTNFHKGAEEHKVGTFEMFRLTETGPDTIARAAMCFVGRRVIIEQGWYPPVFRTITTLIDSTLMAEIVRMQTPGMKDYRDIRDAAGAAAASSKKAD